jgi:hypothetical protein
MAKPINLFQGPAPSAMSQMGAGLVEAGQSIGNAWGNAYSSIGKSIGQGIQTLGAGIGQKMQENKDAESMNKMFDMTLKSPTLSSQLLGIPDDAAGREMRNSLMSQKKDIIKEYGLSGAQQFFKGIIQPLGEREMFGREARMRMDVAGLQMSQVKPTSSAPRWGSQGIRDLRFSKGSSEDQSGQMTIPKNPEDNFLPLPSGQGGVDTSLIYEPYKR